MLLGEQLGRGHHRRLIAVLDRLEHRPQRDHRLAAAHIAHQEPVHLLGPRHIGADIIQGAALRPGQVEGQAGDEAVGERGTPP